MAIDREGGPRSYELFHANPPVSHVEVLKAMIRALEGWQLKELTPEVDEVVTKERLETLSERVFDAAHYGTLAHDVLWNVQQAASGTIYRDFNGELLYLRPHSVVFYCDHVLDQYSSDSADELKAALLRKYEIEGVVLPFDVTVDTNPYRVNSRPDLGRLVGQVVADKIEARRLATYLRLAGLDLHEWKGAPGRALDLLNFVAGTKQEIDPKTTAIDEFLVPCKDLLASLGTEYDCSEGRLKLVREKIQQSFANQLCPQTKWDRVLKGFMCDGECYFRPKMAEMIVEKVPVSTLFALADSYPPSSRNAVVPRALRDLATRYQAYGDTGNMPPPFAIIE